MSLSPVSLSYIPSLAPSLRNQVFKRKLSRQCLKKKIEEKLKKIQGQSMMRKRSRPSEKISEKSDGEERDRNAKNVVRAGNQGQY